MSKSNPKPHDLIQATRKAMGCCVSCGYARAAEGHVLCQSCMEMRNARSAATIARNIAKAACTRCGGARDRPNYRTCSKCAERDDASRKAKLALRLDASPDMCPKCGIRPRGTEFARCDECLERGRKFRLDRKSDIINGYGGKCACCGEAEPQFLTIDHINGGGGVHRKALGGNQIVYTFIRANNYPPEYQLLCFNCNSAKGAFGICPHERDRQRKLTCEPIEAIGSVALAYKQRGGNFRHPNGQAGDGTKMYDKLTAQQAGDYLGMSRHLLIKLLDDGTIPHHRLGTHRRILFSDLRSYKERTDEERKPVELPRL